MYYNAQSPEDLKMIYDYRNYATDKKYLYVIQMIIARFAPQVALSANWIFE